MQGLDTQVAFLSGPAERWVAIARGFMGFLMVLVLRSVRTQRLLGPHVSETVHNMKGAIVASIMLVQGRASLHP